MTPQSSRSATRLKIKLGVRKGQATDGAEDDVGGIAGAAFEVTAAEVTFCFHMSNHRLDRGASSELAFDAAEHAALRAGPRRPPGPARRRSLHRHGLRPGRCRGGANAMAAGRRPA